MKVKEESEKSGLKINIQKIKIIESTPITSWQKDGEKVETVSDFVFLGSKITVDGDCSHKTKSLAPWKKSYDKPRKHMKKQRHYFADKGPYIQRYGFSSSHVQMWELDHKGWVPKNGCFQIVVLDKILESPMDSKEIKSVNLRKSTLNIHWKDWCWSWSSNTPPTWFEEPTYWKWPWCWERLRARKEWGDREWDGWMASSTQLTWVWVNSRI